jgi:hypothetical protein
MSCIDGVRLCLWNAATSRPVVHLLGDISVWRVMVEWYWWENQWTHRKICPSATLSTNPTWTDLGMNLFLRGERLAPIHLKHDMAHVSYFLSSVCSEYQFCVGCIFIVLSCHVFVVVETSSYSLCVCVCVCLCVCVCVCVYVYVLCLCVIKQFEMWIFLM